MSLWHLSPPLFACVNSSDLFTFTVFPFPDLESAEDPFVRSGGLSVDGVYECIYFIAKHCTLSLLFAKYNNNVVHSDLLVWMQYYVFMLLLVFRYL